MKQPRVGILAYGSLIDDLGPDLTPLKVGSPVKTETPFYVEFARSSKSRDGAPTLIPVETGRRVAAMIQEVNTTPQGATNFLYWREKHLPQGSPDRTSYRRPNPVNMNSILIEQWPNAPGFDVVLYTKIGTNIPSDAPTLLAFLAIASAIREAGGRKPPEDGIWYLIKAKQHGIRTDLSLAYEQEILRLTGKKTLDEAWEYCRIGR